MAFKKGDKVLADFSSKKYPNDIKETKILSISNNMARVDTRNILSGAKSANIETRYLKKIRK